MNKIWKPVKGFEGVYEVSLHGRIRRKGSYNLRKPQLTHKGYLKVVLNDKDRKKGLFIHRIVAEAFLKPKEGKNQINHKDGHKLHNWVENLEWCSVLENNQHAKRNNLYKPNFGNKHGMSKLTEDKVKLARKEYADGKPFVLIAKEMNVAPSTIRHAIIRDTWKHI